MIATAHVALWLCIAIGLAGLFAVMLWCWVQFLEYATRVLRLHHAVLEAMERQQRE